MAVLQRELTTLGEAADLACEVADRLRAGDAVLLEGPLGAGKTEIARQMLRHLTGDPGLEVPSPSYTLVQSYTTRVGMVHHLDLWRLDGPAGLVELGWEDMLADVVLVEWPERLGSWRPAAALTLSIQPVNEQLRLARLTGWCGRF